MVNTIKWVVALAGELEKQDRQRKIVVPRLAVEILQAPVLKLWGQKITFADHRAVSPPVNVVNDLPGIRINQDDTCIVADEHIALVRVADYKTMSVGKTEGGG